MNFLRSTTATATTAVLTVALWGVVVAWWTPRGPLTITQGLCQAGISAVIGFAAGRYGGRSRWLLAVVPLAFALAVELTRLRVDGPSVDPPHQSVVGVAVLLAGRGMQALLTLLPMVLGQAIGRGVTGRLGRILIALPTAGLLLLMVMVAIPARTAPIPGGVAELARVGDLGVMIRGGNARAPVLLYVPGAPGGSELGLVREHLGVLEQRFVMATLDRRGGGSSYPALDPTSGVTLDSAVDDIVTVTDYLRKRFAQNRIYLLGHSGGSIVSVLAVQRHPEKYAAYIGTGQAVDLLASDLIFYDDILTWARRAGRDDVARTLEAQGPPPYPDFWGYEPIALHENEAYAQANLGFGVGAREYTLLQKIHTMNALADTWSVLYPRMQDVDLRHDVPRLAVPVWFVQGGDEMRGLEVPFEQWYATVQAPSKRLITVPGAGHRVLYEQPDRFRAALDEVLTDAPAT